MAREIRRHKKQISITVDADLYEFLKVLIKTKECANISHAINMCIARERDRRRYT